MVNENINIKNITKIENSKNGDNLINKTFDAPIVNETDKENCLNPNIDRRSSNWYQNQL